MRRLRSEDSATGKTECDRIELRGHALGMPEPHGDALAHGKRDAPQAIDDLRGLEEEAWRLHWCCPVRPQSNERRKARQGYGLHLTRYDDRGWRATFYTTGMEHSPASATGTAWERTPWWAAAWQRGRANGFRKVVDLIGAPGAVRMVHVFA